MKKVIITIVLLNVLNFAFAQADSIDYKNLYIRAIIAMIDSIPNEYKNMAPNTDLKFRYIIQKNEDIIKKLPSQLKNVNIIYLSIDELRELVAKKNN